MNAVGSKYEQVRHMDIKDIAKLVRADLKKAYPQYRFGVRIERYSMGQTMDVEIKDSGLERRTPEAHELEKAVRGIVDQYNYNDSNVMSDYHNENFHTSVMVERLT